MVNILLVDDMDGNLTILKYIIEEYMSKKGIDAYNIEAYTDPKKAVQIAQNKQIDIIFLDIMMPFINGFEFLDIVRNDTVSKQAIIVMVTALQGKKSKEKNQKYGANAYIIKPIKANIVEMMLERYLEVLKQNSFTIHDKFEFPEQEQEEKSEPNNEFEGKEFYSKYQFDDIDEPLEEINRLIFRIFDSADESMKELSIDLEKEIGNITLVLKAFQSLFANYDELEELRFILGNLNLLFETYNIECIDDQTKLDITETLKNMIYDLMVYKDKVFVENSIENILYIKPRLLQGTTKIDQLLKA